MRLLTVGIDAPGTTSHHRRLVLERLLPGAEAHRIDTAPPFAACSRISRSLAFRLKGGPAVEAVNRHVREALEEMPERFDLVWVDKGVFLRHATLRLLRERAGQLVHYTPDTAFLGNRSRHYERAGGLYDIHITTKSFELEAYRSAFPGRPILLTTQGYHEPMHRPMVAFEERGDEVAFVGLAEPSRFQVVEALLDAGIAVRLAGKGWQRFQRRHGGRAGFAFVAESLSGDDYAHFLSSSRMALGLLSKRFPELHTTRTFEIPACGTVLLTENNEETASFFDEGEAVFHADTADLTARILALRHDPERLRAIAEAGHRRVVGDGRSYDRILGDILRRLGLG